MRPYPLRIHLLMPKSTLPANAPNYQGSLRFSQVDTLNLPCSSYYPTLQKRRVRLRGIKGPTQLTGRLEIRLQRNPLLQKVGGGVHFTSPVLPLPTSLTLSHLASTLGHHYALSCQEPSTLTAEQRRASGVAGTCYFLTETGAWEVTCKLFPDTFQKRTVVQGPGLRAIHLPHFRTTFPSWLTSDNHKKIPG